MASMQHTAAPQEPRLPARQAREVPRPARTNPSPPRLTNQRPTGLQPVAGKPKLMDRLREALRSRHYSRSTEQSYCEWSKRFIFFHHVRHPAEMAEPEINAFLMSPRP